MKTHSVPYTTFYPSKQNAAKTSEEFVLGETISKIIAVGPSEANDGQSSENIFTKPHSSTKQREQQENNITKIEKSASNSQAQNALSSKGANALNAPAELNKQSREFGRELTNASSEVQASSTTAKAPTVTIGKQKTMKQLAIMKPLKATNLQPAQTNRFSASSKNVLQKCNSFRAIGPHSARDAGLQQQHLPLKQTLLPTTDAKPEQIIEEKLATVKAETNLEDGSNSSSHNAQSDDISELKPIKITEVSAADGASTENAEPQNFEQRLAAVADDFKERIQAYRKKISKGMVFSDQLDMRDPQMVSELALDIYATMREQEVVLQVQADYLSKVQLPTEVKDTSRAFLVEWIIDVHRKFRLIPETLYVTVFLIDRYLSVRQIKKSQLHILGVTSLLIATKYEEIYPPELKDLLSVSENKFTRAQVLALEREILSALEFNITAPSAYRFLERYRKLSSAANDDQVFFFAQYLQEISLLDASLLKYRQSEVAAASLILSAKCIKNVNAWNKEIEKATQITEASLAPIVEDVRSFAMEVNPKFLTTLKYKFSKQEYMEVANIALKF